MTTPTIDEAMRLADEYADVCADEGKDDRKPSVCRAALEAKVTAMAHALDLATKDNYSYEQASNASQAALAEAQRVQSAEPVAIRYTLQDRSGTVRYMFAADIHRTTPNFHPESVIAKELLCTYPLVQPTVKSLRPADPIDPAHRYGG